MNLLIDIGNSSVKWRLVNNKKIIINNQCFIKEFECKNLPSDSTITAVLIANVNHASYAQSIHAWYQKHSVVVDILSQKSHPNLINNYQEKERLGIDRWLNALGAWKHFQQSVFVISAGTAITIDFVEQRNNDTPAYQGGMILPGLTTALGALNQSTANVNASMNADISFPAKTTNASVSTGITYAVMGAVNLVCRTQPASVPLVITGGDADWLLSHADPAWQSRLTAQKDLIFEGMLAYL